MLSVSCGLGIIIYRFFAHWKLVPMKIQSLPCKSFFIKCQFMWCRKSMFCDIFFSLLGSSFDNNQRNSLAIILGWCFSHLLNASFSCLAYVKYRKLLIHTAWQMAYCWCAVFIFSFGLYLIFISQQLLVISLLQMEFQN